MQSAFLALVLSCATLGALFALTDAPAGTHGQSARETAPAGVPAKVELAAVEPGGEASLARDAAPRDVTAPGMVAAPHFDAPPVRKARSEPKAAPARAEPEPERLYRVVVSDAGSFEANGNVVRIAGVETRAADATCRDARGRKWPCGRQAKAALQRLIRARAVECEAPAGQGARVCRVGGVDLAGWLIRQGWAEPASPEAYAEDLAAAREAERGLWRQSALAAR